MLEAKDHTFVVCAYKESPYLELCLKSLLTQSLKTHILMETSTPCEYISNMASKYDIPLVLNPGQSSCALDWNYGFNKADTRLVTIAHQDDIYDADYAKTILEYANKAKDPILFYTDYYEIRNNTKVYNNKLLNIKRWMNAPMKRKNAWSNIWLRRRILSFGDAISCPTVTLVKEKVGKDPYDTSYTCSCDYKTWTDLTPMKGDFVYIPVPLMGHRIYEESHTTIYLKENIRQKEDLNLLCSYWPKPIGKMIYHFYSKSQDSNDTKNV